MKRIPKLFVLFVCLYSGLAFGDSCMSLSAQIDSDIAKYGNTLSSKPLDWMNLQWLTSNLPKTTTQSQGDNITYRWDCDSDSGTYIKITFNKQKFVEVEGVSSSNQGSNFYKYPSLPAENTTNNAITNNTKSSLPPFSEQTVMTAAADPRNRAATRQFFISLYGNYSTPADLKILMINRTLEQFKAMRECKVGEYLYPIPDLQTISGNKIGSLLTAGKLKILGMINNHCEVEFYSYDVKPEKCSYSQEGLKLFSDQNAIDVLQHEGDVTKLISNVEKEACKTPGNS